VFSAFGIANTDFMRSYERSCDIKLYAAHSDHWLDDYEAFNSVISELQVEALRDAEDLGLDRVIWGLELYLRYGLQPHVTRIRSPRLELASREDVAQVYEAFEDEYTRIYSQAATFLAGGVEIVGMTLWSTVQTQKLDLPIHRLESADPSAARKGVRPVFWGPEHGWIESHVYDLANLKPGNHVEGPAIIEAIDTTIVIDLERTFRVDERGSGVIDRKS
jgi:N-methylhydantoinase A/acetophenone carboxylase